MKNKKAQIFPAFMVILAAIILSAGAIKLAAYAHQLEDGKNIKHVGGHGLEIVKKYQEGEMVLYYLDKAAEYSAEKALYWFEHDGHNPSCGMAENFMFWKSQDKECYPDKVSVSLAFRKEFSKIYNKYLSNFGLFGDKFLFNKTSSADFVLDLEEQEFRGLPFNSKFVDKEKEYAIPLVFEIDLGHDFDYSGIIEKIKNIIELCEAKQDLNILKEEELTLCVQKELEETWKLDISCEEDKDFYRFVEEYNDCARSLDNNCQCPISEFDSDIRLEQDKATYDGLEQDLILPFAGQSLSLPLYKIGKEIKHDSSLSNIPICRINDRVFKFCITHDRPVKLGADLVKPLVTRFAVFVDDKAPPPEVVSVKDATGYKWDASPAPDVKEYRVFELRKGLPFVLPKDKAELEKANSIVERAANSGEKLSYTVNTDSYDIGVVAVDFSGNWLGKQE